MTNNQYFEYSLSKPDPRLDLSNPLGFLVITKDSRDTPTELMTNNKKLLELITTYKTIRNKPDADATIKSVINDVYNIIQNEKIKINYSPFLTYLQVLGYSASDFVKELKKSNEETRQIWIKTLLDNYIVNRHNIYLSHGYSDSMLQIRADCSKNRTKSVAGNRMIEAIINPLKIKEAESLEEFAQKDRLFIYPDRGDKKIFKKYLDSIGFKYVFKENKLPDMVIKDKNKLYFLEHKIVNGEGGHQNNQLNEVITFINQSYKNVSFISCVSGDYLSRLNVDNLSDKKKTQKKNILCNLKKHSNNFLVNNNGLSILLNNLLKK